MNDLGRKISKLGNRIIFLDENGVMKIMTEEAYELLKEREKNEKDSVQLKSSNRGEMEESQSRE